MGLHLISDLCNGSAYANPLAPNTTQEMSIEDGGGLSTGIGVALITSNGL